MAGVAEEVAANLLGKVIDRVLVLIKRQLNYLCCFRSNVRCLMDEAKELEDALALLQRKVDEATNDGKDITHVVTTWQSKTSKILHDKHQLETEIPTVGCFSVVSRYSLSRKAKKTSAEMKRLRGDKFDDNNIGVPKPPMSQTWVPPSLGEMEFASRKRIQDEIFKALQDNKDKKIGIHGMGGVGKTTMAEEIINRVRSQSLFKDIIMVVVSKSVDDLKIQEQIAESLRFKDLKEMNNLSTRAHALRTRLAINSTLIVLDDIWEELKLEKIGIPCESGSQGCTVLLTSRDIDALEKMDARTFRVEILPEEEALSLFSDKVGNCMNDPDFASIGKDVIKECNGLPVAIVTVGGTLKGKETPYWRDVLRQLRSPVTSPIPSVLKEVYTPLRVSYDNLEEPDAKVLFLLCCLFPDDYNISLDDLIVYMVGLKVFEGIRNLSEMRNRAFKLVDILKSRSLLLDGEKEYGRRWNGKKDYVKMHDVIRDVARCIVSTKGKIGYSNSSDQKWISINKGPDKFEGSNYKNLQLLLVHSEPKAEELSSWEEMGCLNVLSLKHLKSEIPTQILERSVLLKNLRTLEVSYCHSISDISVVGELSNLEILKCNSCLGIGQLPTEITNLKMLKLLDISYCGNLRKIAPRVISKLVELEELKMRGSFHNWESRHLIGENASLAELESLTKLRWLEIDIMDATLLVEEMNLSKDIVRYDVAVVDIMSFHDPKWRIMKHGEKHIEVSTKTGIQESWCRAFLSNAECLHLHGQFSKVDLSQVLNWQGMEIDRCRTMTIVNEGKVNMFQVNEGKVNFGDISLSNLDEVEGVFFNEDDNNQVTFTKLKKLKLSHMSNLTTFCEGFESIEFPLLRSLTIESCPKLEIIISPSNSTGCNHLFCNEKVIMFKKLEEVRITQWNNNLWCKQTPDFIFNQLVVLEIAKRDNTRSLFTFSILEKLVNLQRLSVKECNQMETVIANEDDKMEGNFPDVGKATSESITHWVFSKLNTITFYELPCLKTFCEGIESIDFPVLHTITIDSCPKFVNIISSQECHQNLPNGQNSESLHLFCQEKVKFTRLVQIYISGYGGADLWCQNTSPNLFRELRILEVRHSHAIKRLFPSSIVKKHLKNLGVLDIQNCHEMENVITEDEEMVDEMLEIFPSLIQLRLFSLPKLRAFYERKPPHKLPLLRLPRLEEIETNYGRIKCTKTEGCNEIVHNTYLKEGVHGIRSNGFRSATYTFFADRGFLQFDEYYEASRNVKSGTIVEKGEAVASLFKSIQPMTALLKELNDDIEKLKETNNLGQIISNEDWAWDKLNSQQFISLTMEDQMDVVHDIQDALEDKKECPSQTDIDSTVLAIKNKLNSLVSLHEYIRETDKQIRTVVSELDEAMVKLEEDSKAHSAKDFFVSQAISSLSMKLKGERCTQHYTYFGSQYPFNLGMVKAEIAYLDIQDVMHWLEVYFKFLCEWLLKNWDSLEKFMNRIDDGKAIERLQGLVESKFGRITYTEVIQALDEAFNDGKIENAVEWGMDLSLEHERYLVNEKFNSPFFIYDYPKTNKSFYMKINEDNKTVASMEFFLPKVGKLGSGSQREENSELFKNNILEAGLPIDAYEWYLEIMPYKNIKHAGFQLLFDQLFLFVTNMNSTELEKITQIRR